MRKLTDRNKSRKAWSGLFAAAGVSILALQLGGCKSAQTSSVEVKTGTNQAEASETGAGMGEENADLSGQKPQTGEGRRAGGGMNQGGSVSEHEGNGKTGEYKDSDIEASWNEADASVINCSGNEAEVEGDGGDAADGIISITKEGTYVLRGDYIGQIQINVDKEEKVRLVLDGFSISCESSSPIYGIQSDKIILTLADGTKNQITDGSAYVFASDEEDEPDAAVFSKDDLTINGTGTLIVEGNYKNGIRTKNDLKIISGTLNVTAVKDAVKGKDSVTVKDGTLTIKSGEDGIKSNEDGDEEKGYVIIDGGSITIEAGDDGIHAETWLTINDGAIDITESYEGLEGRKVDINGGTIRVKSSDDGINAAFGTTDDTGGERAKMQADPDTYVRITGGTIRVDASADGIDSNGDLIMEGGIVMISGPEMSGDGALDYNGGAVINGGSFVAAGSSGMMQTFSEESGQKMLMVYYEEQQAAGTTITLASEDGTELISFQPEKAYECVLISVPELEDNKTYGLTTGSDSQEITVDGVITQVGERTGGPGGFDGGGGGRGGKVGGRMGGGKRPEGESLPDEGMNQDGGAPPEGKEPPAGEETPPEKKQ